MSSDLTVQEEQNLAPIADDSLIAMAENAEAKIDAIKKIFGLALKVTNERDWTLINGEPYMEASGAEKIAVLFNLSWTIEEPEVQELIGGHFIYTYKGKFRVGGRTIDAVGSRSSQDKFFIKYEWIQVPGKSKKVKTPLPVSAISRGDVKKSAYTNLINNGIKRSLGLRKVTKDDLSKAGFVVDNIKGYDHKREDMSVDGIDKAAETERMLIEMYGNDYAAQLARITENRDKTGKLWPGIKTLNGCSEKQLPIVHRQVKKEYDDWKKKSGFPKPVNSKAPKQDDIPF